MSEPEEIWHQWHHNTFEHALMNIPKIIYGPHDRVAGLQQV